MLRSECQSWQNIWKFRPAEGPAKDAECKVIKMCAAMCSHWIPFFNLKKHKQCRRVAIRWQDSRPLEFYRFACFLDQIDVTRSVPRNSHTAVVGTIYLSRCCSSKPGEFLKSDPGTVLIVPWAPWSGSSLLASLLSLRFVLRSTLKNMLRNTQQEWRRSTAAIARLPQTFSPQLRAAKCSRASRSANSAAALQALVLHGFAWFCMVFLASRIWKHLRLMLLYTPKAVQAVPPVLRRISKSVLEMGRVVLPPL